MKWISSVIHCYCCNYSIVFSTLWDCTDRTKFCPKWSPARNARTLNSMKIEYSKKKQYCKWEWCSVSVACSVPFCSVLLFFNVFFLYFKQRPSAVDCLNCAHDMINIIIIITSKSTKANGKRRRIKKKKKNTTPDDNSNNNSKLMSALAAWRSNLWA